MKIIFILFLVTINLSLLIAQDTSSKTFALTVTITGLNWEIYQLRKTTSFQPKSVVNDSVKVPTPYMAMPNAHHHRCGAGLRISHRRYTRGANHAEKIVVAIGM